MGKVWLLIAAAALGACTAAGSRPSETERVPSAQPPVGAADNLTVYLDMLEDLLEGDAVLQADVFRGIVAAADAAPTTTNRLRVALALATPRHPGSDPVTAQRQLAELLATGDALLPEERVLALIHLKEVEQRLILDAEAVRLQSAVTAANNAPVPRDERTAERLAAALEENRELRLALDEANAKLEAITNIERSIRERDNGTDPR
jgi:hypothetical protein